MKARTIFVVLVMFMGTTLCGQTPRSATNTQLDPYVEMRAAGADTVPRITTKFHVDPFWPKPLPHDWILGAPAGVCADSKDHVFVFERVDEEQAGGWNGSSFGPPMLEFDPAGNLVNSWGDLDVFPSSVGGGDVNLCYVDYQDNVWVGSGSDSIVQKYSHDGKLLLQIGTKKKFDTSDGTAKGKAMNSSPTLLNRPTEFAVDPANGDVYIADGSGNRRVVVFDRTGKFIRQMGRQATKEEAEAGVGGAFAGLVNNLALSNDGLLYVGDRDGKRIHVFDKMGNFKKNISVPRRRKELAQKPYQRKGLTIAPSIPDKSEVFGILISRDKTQKYLYVGTPEGLIWTVERESGRLVSAFGQRGYGTGEIRISNMTINSKGDIFIGAANRGLQKFRAVGED